uniref:Peptidase S72 domain-containing protein n=1 Tax=Caenorhabditis tropicalis TaxID=1561998 RepID=A0A1I7T8V7_9PELO
MPSLGLQELLFFVLIVATLATSTVPIGENSEFRTSYADQETMDFNMIAESETNNAFLRFECWRGTVCNITLPYDIEVNSKPIISSLNGPLFLEANGKQNFTGVPMDIGVFGYSWTFETASGAFAEIPFEIHIKFFPEASHVFDVIILRPKKQEFEEVPHHLLNFVSTLSKTLEMDVNTISIEGIQQVGPTTTVSVFLNAVPTDTCDLTLIEKALQAIFVPNRKRPSFDFLRKMDVSFRVRNVLYRPKGICLGTTSGVKMSSTVITTTIAPESQFNIEVFALALLVVVIATAFPICQCVIKKRAAGREQNEGIMNEEETML